MVSGVWGSGSHCMQSGSRGMLGVRLTLFFIQYPPALLGSSTFPSCGLPSSIRPWKRSHRHAWKYVSMAILTAVKWTRRIHHARLLTWWTANWLTWIPNQLLRPGVHSTWPFWLYIACGMPTLNTVACYGCGGVPWWVSVFVCGLCKTACPLKCGQTSNLRRRRKKTNAEKGMSPALPALSCGLPACSSSQVCPNCPQGGQASLNRLFRGGFSSK